jgi:N6-adenosine-specific RNA methylase IME4
VTRSVPAIVQVAQIGTHRLLALDAKVDAAEGDGILARWEFGRALLQERIGKQLPKGRLDELVKATGKSREELGCRMRFAERYASEAEVRNLVTDFGSWHGIVNEALAKQQHEPVHSPVVAPPGTFATIVADPPWRYDNKATRGAAEDHYPTMSVEELSALPVKEWSAGQAHLYLWTTNGFLREAFGVMDAWGFEYKTTLVWVKPQIGLGNYFRSSAEYVLFGIKGGLRTRDCNQPNWFEAPRQRHSQKPGRFFDLVEQVSFPPYLEMFARQRRLSAEWDYWGNEV